MDLNKMHECLAEVTVRLRELKEEQDALKQLEGALANWLEFQEMALDAVRLSFPKGLEQVLKDAQGDALTVDEIWERMQALGVRSNGKRPTKFIPLNAKNNEGVECVEEGVYRWALANGKEN